MKEDKGSGAEAESQSQLVAKEDNKGNVDLSFFFFAFRPVVSLHITFNHQRERAE